MSIFVAVMFGICIGFFICAIKQQTDDNTSAFEWYNCIVFFILSVVGLFAVL